MKKAYITVDSRAKGVVEYSLLIDSVYKFHKSGLNEAYVFYEAKRGELNVSFVKMRFGSVMSEDSPIENVPRLSNIYSSEKYDSSKLEAILKTSPVGIIVPNKKYAKKLEEEITNLGYDFERMDYETGFKKILRGLF